LQNIICDLDFLILEHRYRSRKYIFPQIFVDSIIDRIRSLLDVKNYY